MGVIVDEPNWIVKSCCRVGVAGKTRSSVFARLSCRWCSFNHDYSTSVYYSTRLATVKSTLNMQFYCIGGGGVRSQYLVWPLFASRSATHLLRIELIRLLIVACGMLVHSSSMAVWKCWILAGTGTHCRIRRSRASQTCSMGDMSGAYAGHARTGTLPWKLATSVALCCVINCNLEWPVIVASLRHTCALIMLSNQHLDYPTPVRWMDYLGKWEDLATHRFRQICEQYWGK